MNGRLMTPLRGLEVQCAGDRCRAWTGDQAPSRSWRTPQAAVHAAKALGWIAAVLEPGTPAVWLCPLHQRFDETSRRWVPAPHGRNDPNGKRVGDAQCRHCGHALIPDHTRTGWSHRDSRRVHCPDGIGLARAVGSRDESPA